MMEETIELLFGNRFFQLPFLEAMSYIAAALLIGAIFVGLTRRLMGSSAQPVESTVYRQPSYSQPYEESYEWRKAA
ncbi:MAG TPA: hypothetical protein VFH05_10530 [Nitrospira sp.]|jgi:hypothetical protein|nr:hypothetical protein [Nitrospira sp.]